MEERINENKWCGRGKSKYGRKRVRERNFRYNKEGLMRRKKEGLNAN